MGKDLAAQVQWLIDRAAISERLHAFASALDRRDWTAYVDLYAEDGRLELPRPEGGTLVMLRSEMPDKVPKSLGRYGATHHISSNHQITVEGDEARSRSYLQAVHVRDKPTDHWMAGGWYDCRFRRIAGDWKFTQVKLSMIWLEGDPGSIDPGKAPMPPIMRRIVTGHDDQGRAVVFSDAPPERVQKLGEHGPTFYEIWNTRETPARIDRRSGEPAEARLTLLPPRNGTRIRILDIPPEDPSMLKLDQAAARDYFAQIGAPEASTAPGAPHPMMHRTESIDYGIVIEGEITLILDVGEVIARAGDVVVQRGTNHAWSNRSGRNCRIAFVLIDGRFDTGL